MNIIHLYLESIEKLSTKQRGKIMKTAQEYKKLSIKEFNKAAHNYESDNSGIYEMCKEDYQPILDEIKKQNFKTLLDAGCATGPMLSLLNTEYPDKNYVGLDLSPKMIEIGKQKNLKNTDFIEGDCENMPLEDNSFDIVINSQSFHHYPNPIAFFKEVYRVLKPGGKLILRDNTASKIALFFINNISMKILNLAGYGDVKTSSIEEIEKYCNLSGLKIQKLEKQKNSRLHLVAIK